MKCWIVIYEDNNGDSTAWAYKTRRGAEDGVREDVRLSIEEWKSQGIDVCFADEDYACCVEMYSPNTNLYWKWTIIETRIFE